MKFQIPAYLTESTFRRDILILLVLSSFIMLFNLGSGSLSSWDEAYYAQISREMYQSSNWIDITWGGRKWADKPPLYMWVTACFYKVFGVNEFSARLGSSIAGILLVILIYLFARRLFSPRAGMLSGLMTLSTYHLVWFSKMGTLDITFTLFLVLSIYCFLRSEERPVYLIFSFIWFGYLFLTKGVGALLVPMILGVYVLSARKWKMIFNRYLAGGIVVFILVTGSWYYFAYRGYGQFLINGHFMQHVVTRTTSAMDGHYGNWITYINVVLYKGKPWGTVGLILLPYFIFWTLKRRLTQNYVLISWIFVTFLLFTGISTKLHWYIIPVYPAVIMVAGWGANRLLGRYAVPVVAVVGIVSLVYFGAEKGIFTLDYNPGVKSFSEEVRERLPEDGNLYLYRIGDPGIRFYFGEKGKNIHTQEEIRDVRLKKGDIVIMGKEESLEFKGKGKIITDKKTGLTEVRMQ